MSPARDGASNAPDADLTSADAALDGSPHLDASPSTDSSGPADGSAPIDSGAPSPPLPSAGCESASATYSVGTTPGMIESGSQTRTFRVHVPPRYDAGVATPVVVMLHGGGGSGRQLELNSSRMDPVADREGFITVYPDGTGIVRTWNAGGCCGGAVTNDVDDVGFISDLLDHLESSLCVDRNRVYVAGMSNGAMMSHRLACELSARFAAIAPVAGVDMTTACQPSRPVPVMQIHGSEDGHVPWEGGLGCGPAGVPYTSVPDSMEGWRLRNGCSMERIAGQQQGDGACEVYRDCAASTILCTIGGGGHSWPGGEPNAGVVDCPADGTQSTSFLASEQIWRFFSRQSR